MKKLLSLALAVIMVLTVLPLSAYAKEDEDAPIIQFWTLSALTEDGSSIAEAGDKVLVSVYVYDNVKVESVSMRIDSYLDGKNRNIDLIYNETTKLYERELNITADTTAGMWNISQILATDTSGNYMYASGLQDYYFYVKGTITDENVKLLGGTSHMYTSYAIKPDVEVTYKGLTLSEGIDYKVSYKNNTNVGTATLTVKGIGAFGGTFVRQFKITPCNVFTVTLSNDSYVYNRKVKNPKVTVKSGKRTVGKANYTVKYKKGRKLVGRYFVSVKMKNNYKGSRKVYFTVKPKNVSSFKGTVVKGGFRVEWKKQTVQTTGYQIQYSTEKSINYKPKYILVKSNKTVKRKIKAKGKKYYFRIRTYKTVNGKKIYSKWSKTKIVKAK